MKIIPHLKAVTALIAENQVSQVEAETGTGKSIMIPGTLALEKGLIVYVAVPRVTSAITLCEFAKRTFPSLRIGYGAEGRKQYSAHTQVVYATSGHIRRRLFSTFSNGKTTGFNFCDVLIVDEMHTGSVDNTVIMSLWDYARKLGVKVPKLVMLSATPTDSFLTPLARRYYIEVERPYPVEVMYHPVLSNPMEPREVYEEAISIVSKLEKEKGDILIFAHGAGPIEDMIAILERQLNKDDTPENFIIGAYRAMSSEDLDRIYRPAPNGERKIIIATNIAESSITIDGVGVVIDTLFENRAFTSSTGGLRLSTVHVSKDSAKQRLGRTGRTRNGECHRLMSEVTYAGLEDHTPLEIMRVPIHEVVMEFISAGLDPLTIIKDIPVRKIQESIEVLTELKAIDGSKVTDLGYFLPQVPLGVRNGAFLYKWLQSGYPTFPGIIVAALIDVYSKPGYFYLPQKEKTESIYDYKARLDIHFSEHVEPYVGSNTLHTYLKLWVDFSKNMNRNLFDIIVNGGFSKTQYSYFHDWANDAGLNIRKWKDLLNIIKQINNHVYRMPERTVTGVKRVGSFDPNNVLEKATVILKEVYKHERLINKFGNTYIHEKTSTKHILDTRNPISEAERGELPKYIIPLDSAEIKGRHFVSFAIPYIPSEAEITEERTEMEELLKRLSMTEEFIPEYYALRAFRPPDVSELKFQVWTDS